jgi:acetyltransferase-like isoleucine patch superfamily enzyme
VKPWRVVRGAPLFLWEMLAGIVRSNHSRAGTELRSWLYRTRCRLDAHVHITNRRNFSCGTGSALHHSTHVLNGEGTLTLGRDSHLGAFCFVNVQHGAVSIGDFVAIGPGTKIIAYSNHYRAGRNVTDERVTADVRIGNNVFIGANCSILPGTIVHDNVVIGAGSVVRGELQGNAIYAGVPCKLISSGWHDEPRDA